MYSKIKTISILLFIMFSLSAKAENPFLKNNTSDSPIKSNEIQTEKSDNYPGFMKNILHKSNKIQKELNKKISTLIKKIKNKSYEALVLLFFFSFIYGIIHAIGPGHGKVIVSSFFLSNQSKIIHGIIAGILISFVHTSSAVLLTITLFFAIKTSLLSRIENASLFMMKISYLLILFFGIFLLTMALYKIIKKKNITAVDDNDENNTAPQKIKKNIPALAIAVGIVPCPGATMILLFTLNHGIALFGIFSIFFMSLGMSMTISLFAIASIILKEYFSKAMLKKSRGKELIFLFTEALGGFLVLTIGLTLFIGIL